MVADQANAERRIVTTLFADLVGSTELAEGLDPEDLDSLLGRFFAAMEATISRLGGVVEKYIGDAVVAYFGAHRAFGDDATRAVRAGLAMQRRLAALRAEEPAHYGTLRMRIGVESGEVLVTPGRETERLATGSSLNVAARIQSAAEDGTVLVGERAARQSAAAIVYSDPWTIVAKGVATPVEVRTALDEVAGRSAATPFVGREPTLARLLARLRPVADGPGGIVTVAGARGSGRSRLVDGAHAELDVDVLWLEGGSRYAPSAPGYALFVDLLRTWLDLDLDATAPIEATALAIALEAHVGTDLAAEVAPRLAMLLDPAATPGLPGDVVGRQVFRAMRALVAGLSARRPVVVVADDLEAADDDSLRLLAHIAPLARTHRVLVVAVLPTAPGALLAATLEEWRRGGLVDSDEIRLAPLPADQARTLVSSLLPHAAHDVVEAVVERGAGEPYLLEQLATAVAATGAGAAHSVPDTVRGAIQARLDTLDDDAKERLRAAAVLSADVTPGVIEAMLGAPSSAEVRMLADAGLLTTMPGGGETYRFADPLVQEVVYQTVPKALRARWHEVAARWLSAHTPDAHAALAFHYAGSGQGAQARRSLILAGDEAGSIAADATALRHYRAALDTAGTADWDPVERSTLERKIGEALLRLGSYDRARSHFERGLEVLGDQYPSSATEIRRRSATGLAAALVPMKRRPADAGQRDLATERARLYARLGWVDYFSDGDRFFLDALRTVHFGAAGGEASFETAQGLMGIGLGLDVNGNGRLAARFHRRALEVAEAAADPFAIGFAHLGSCIHEHHLTGRWDAALRHARAGMDAFASVDASHEWGSIAYIAAWILGGRGTFDEALDICDRMLADAEQTGDRHLAAWATEAAGRICLLSGDPERALVLLSGAADPLAAIPDNMNWARTQAESVQARAELGELDAATDVLESTERFVRVHDVRGFYRSELAVARARLALAGEVEDGGADAVAAAGKAASTDWEGRVEAHRLAATLAVRRGQPAVARRELDRAHEVAGRLGSALYEAVVTRDLWRLTGDQRLAVGLGPAFAVLGLDFDLDTGGYGPGAELGNALDTFARRITDTT